CPWRSGHILNRGPEEKAPPKRGLKCTGIYTSSRKRLTSAAGQFATRELVPERKAPQMTGLSSRATTSKLGRGITLSGMTRFAQIAVVPSPGPLAVRTHGGSGRFAIRALPDLCLGIVSGRLEFAL